MAAQYVDSRDDLGWYGPGPEPQWRHTVPRNITSRPVPLQFDAEDVDRLSVGARGHRRRNVQRQVRVVGIATDTDATDGDNSECARHQATPSTGIEVDIRRCETNQPRTRLVEPAKEWPDCLQVG